MSNLMWTGTTGTYVFINGKLGTTTGFVQMNGRVVGAFVKIQDGPMMHVTVHATADKWHAEIAESRIITRDEFDTIQGIDGIRLDLGWRI